MKRLALLSVTDKSGIAEFAIGLQEKGFEILSTGGTAECLRKEDVDVTGVSYYTGMPEILDGRVKTLHPKIHGGLLAKPDEMKHRQEMEELNIRRIEVLAVNLYPFEETVRKGAASDEVIENIDIGGPAMVRAAAKNAENVFVVVDPADYQDVLENVDSEAEDLRRRLQAKAFAHTAFYDSLIAEHLSQWMPGKPGETVTLGYRLVKNLRYGENPHQEAALCARPFEKQGVAAAEQVWGKDLSYNNLLDAEAAWELACDLLHLYGGQRRPCIIAKHGNPCGAGWSPSPADSFSLAKLGDPISAFGGIVAVPGELDLKTAQRIAEKGNFFEVIVCGGIAEAAMEVFRNRAGWGKNVRILLAGDPPRDGYLAVRGLRGAALMQTADTEDAVEWRCATERRPTDDQEEALRSAWRVVKHVRSNAITVASQERLLGVGAGQMNRVQSVLLALDQAGDLARGAALASDAFFPFPDSIEAAAKAGIAAVVQPGGSKKDDEVVKAANELGLAMVLTGVRHFRH
ncbi:MAG: bifunctional phosphoribosylaminoimidazolecarboxamide formyltransferase/IMP cyclohydrolase [Armatimonadetes bacterium]|nr:bifunctional phosphoribosylaminoimidazolecarboxamide formyltransferase/IMP cyclohydrolase [Armatimonadota bacterium]